MTETPWDILNEDFETPENDEPTCSDPECFMCGDD